MEIERQFFVKEMPDITGAAAVKIKQGYISFNPEIRLRQLDDKFLLTVKKGFGLVRQELELEISAAEYSSLLPKIEGNLLEKTRYHLPLAGGLTAELDVFAGKLAGLSYVEIEFPSAEVARAFSPLPWFGREITNLECFSNKLLTELDSFAELDKTLLRD